MHDVRNTVLIFHYEDDKRVEKPPELLVKPGYVQLLREYHEKTGRMIPSGHNFPGSRQELATADDYRAFNKWMKAKEKT